MSTCDHHAAEYSAAVAAMNEFYGVRLTPPTTIVRDGIVTDTHAIGDYVEFVTHDGEPRRGYVIEALDGDVYHVRCHLTGGGQQVLEAHIDQFRPF